MFGAYACKLLDELANFPRMQIDSTDNIPLARFTAIDGGSMNRGHIMGIN